MLAATEVGEVWGVGRRIGAQLQDGGIRTVLDLVRLDPQIEAVSEFASRAAEKLRKQSSVVGQVLVFVHTSPFRPGP